MQGDRPEELNPGFGKHASSTGADTPGPTRGNKTLARSRPRSATLRGGGALEALHILPFPRATFTNAAYSRLGSRSATCPDWGASLRSDGAHVRRVCLDLPRPPPSAAVDGSIFWSWRFQIILFPFRPPLEPPSLPLACPQDAAQEQLKAPLSYAGRRLMFLRLDFTYPYRSRPSVRDAIRSL